MNFEEEKRDCMKLVYLFIGWILYAVLLIISGFMGELK